MQVDLSTHVLLSWLISVWTTVAFTIGPLVPEHCVLFLGSIAQEFQNESIESCNGVRILSISQNLQSIQSAPLAQITK